MAHSVPCVVWRSAWLACVAIALRARTAAATKRIELARPELPPLGGQEQELEFSKAADPNEPEGILQRRRLTGAFSIHIPQPWYSSERRPINDWKGNVPLLGSTPEERRFRKHAQQGRESLTSCNLCASTASCQSVKPQFRVTCLLARSKRGLLQ